jgi:hypothetical protein
MSMTPTKPSTKPVVVKKTNPQIIAAMSAKAKAAQDKARKGK